MRMVYDVFDFQVATEQIQPGTLPGPELRSLYAKLIDEEYQEVKTAPNDVEKLHECMDLIWVTLGYAIAHGWDIHGAWAEVARANMAKVQLDPTTGKVKRREDGKILKPADWVGPDLTPFV